MFLSGSCSVYTIWDCGYKFKNDTDKPKDSISPLSFWDDAMILQTQSFQGIVASLLIGLY